MPSGNHSGLPLKEGPDDSSNDNNNANTSSPIRRAFQKARDLVRGDSDDEYESPYVQAWMEQQAPEADDDVDHEGDGIPAERDVDEDESGDQSSEQYGRVHGQRAVPSRSDERRAEMNVTGSAPDRLSEPDAVQTTSNYLLAGASTLTDPTGDQLVGVASSLDESDPVSAVDSTAEREPLELVPLAELDKRTVRFRMEKTIPTPELTSEEAEGVDTTDLEVTLPDGRLVPLASLVPNPEQYSRSSLPGIERRLALDAEIKKVSAGIDAHGRTTGVAKMLNDHMDALAEFRFEHSRAVSEWREQKIAELVKLRSAPLRELASQDQALCDQVLEDARRIIEDNDHVHEVRKTPVDIAAGIARAVLRGRDPTSAFLDYAEMEKLNPLNVIRVRNILDANLGLTKGHVTTQGRVKKVYYPDNPNIKFGFVLEDDQSCAYIAVWHPSEREITRSTADPDDEDGEVIISRKTFVEPNEGDYVRLRDFKLPLQKDKREYNGQPSLNSRWESEIEVLVRAPVNADDQVYTPQRVDRSTSASEDGDAISRSRAANFIGEISNHWPVPERLEQIVDPEIMQVAEQSRLAAEAKAKAKAATISLHPETAEFYDPDSEPNWDSSTCWVCGCRTGSMSHDSDVLAFYHPLCLDRAGVSSCDEYEEQRQKRAHFA